jgi:hypothetical protein
MAKQVKKQASKKTVTKFRLVHEPLILNGSSDVVRGWLGAGAEAKTLGTNASEYAKASLSASNAGEVRNSDSTIRTNVSIALRALSKYGKGKTTEQAINNVIIACEAQYTYATWASIKAMMSGQGERSSKKSTSRFSAKRTAEALSKKYTKAQLLEVVKYMK